LKTHFPGIDLEEEVRKLVAQVPEGMVTTYGDVAKALGDVVASRFVGKVMSKNEDIVRVPCRRVVRSDGTLGGYSGGDGLPTKKKLLQAEGVEIIGQKIADFEKIRFTDFRTTYPLKKYRKIQRNDSKKIVLEDDFSSDAYIAGADIAYDGEDAFAVLMLLDRKGGEVIQTERIRTKVTFPYIPTYLSFREAPAIMQLSDGVDDDYILVYDGNGIMHPMGFGIASHLGVMLDLPVIGVAKKQLCGSLSGSGKTKRVLSGGRHVGFAVSGENWSSPVYVSPGNRISTGSSLSLLQPLWKFRLPEPVRRAHIEAERFRRGDV